MRERRGRQIPAPSRRQGSRPPCDPRDPYSPHPGIRCSRVSQRLRRNGPPRACAQSAFPGGAAVGSHRPISRFRARLAESRRRSKDVGQPVDRHHHDVMLDALDAPRTDQTHDAKSAATCPPSPASRQPRRLLSNSSEVTHVVRPRFGLDRNRDAGGSDCHRVDVALATPTSRSAEGASPPPRGVRARAAPRPPSGRRLDCAARARRSGERRGRARTR